MFIIGLVEDDPAQLTEIRRTIKASLRGVESLDFKEYSIPSKSSDCVTILFDQIMQDIVEKKIDSLIIDYKIMIETVKIKGTDIFEKIKEEVPKFPIIMLTDVFQESQEPDFIDEDKVYKKSEFFKIKSDYSKEKITNIVSSMRKYVAQRDRLQMELDDLKNQLASGALGKDAIASVIALESKLGDFIPTDQSQIDKVFDTDKLTNVIALLEKVNSLLE